MVYAGRAAVNSDQVIPRLRAGVRITHDDVRGQMALLHPEGVALLNATAGATLALVNGRTNVAEIAAALDSQFQDVRGEQILGLLWRLEEARLVEVRSADCDGLARAAFHSAREQAVHEARGVREASTPGAAGPAASDSPAPLGLLAELTHRCPLHCPYCSNPLQLTETSAELPTSAWLDIFGQARRLGVLQVHLSGGEPLLRRDLEVLAAGARSLGMYVNLVTSGVGLTTARAQVLAEAGVDHVQLSLQGAEAAAADLMAGARAHQRKLEAAAAVRAAGMVLTINVVLHRGNTSDIDALVELAASLRADRVELAHAQYYGWALRNRAALLPPAEQVRRAEDAVRSARNRHPQMMIIYVVSDYHEKTPKPCMNGWGSRQLTVTPDGTVLPCPAATVIPGLEPPSIHDAPLASIWATSEAFTRFRGTAWLPEPCHSCPAREIDLGGCRCQAYQLLGDARLTDPVCEYSPSRHVVDEAVATAAATPGTQLIYRARPRDAPQKLRMQRTR